MSTKLDPFPGFRVEPIKRRGVLVGGQEPSTDRVHVEPIRHRSQVFTRGRQVGCACPRLPIEHLGLRDELFVVLPAGDHELVTDNRCRARPPAHA